MNAHCHKIMSNEIPSSALEDKLETPSNRTTSQVRQGLVNQDDTDVDQKTSLDHNSHAYDRSPAYNNCSSMELIAEQTTGTIEERRPSQPKWSEGIMQSKESDHLLNESALKISPRSLALIDELPNAVSEENSGIYNPGVGRNSKCQSLPELDHLRNSSESKLLPKGNASPLENSQATARDLSLHDPHNNMISIRAVDLTRLQNQIIELKATNYVLEERLLNRILESEVTHSPLQPASFLNRLSRTVFPTTISSPSEAEQLRSQLTQLQNSFSKQEKENHSLQAELIRMKETSTSFQPSCFIKSSSESSVIENGISNTSHTIPSEERLGSTDLSDSVAPPSTGAGNEARELVLEILQSCRQLLTPANLQWALERLETSQQSCTERINLSEDSSSASEARKLSISPVFSTPSPTKIVEKFLIGSKPDVSGEVRSDTNFNSHHDPSFSLDSSPVSIHASRFDGNSSCTSVPHSSCNSVLNNSCSSLECSAPLSSIVKAVELLFSSMQVSPSTTHDGKHISLDTTATVVAQSDEKSETAMLGSHSSPSSLTSYTPILIIPFPKRLEMSLLRRQTCESFSSPDEHKKSQEYLNKISQQQKELQVLNEIISRQTQQLTQLTMQVTDFKTEIDDVASLNLVEKVSSLEERITTLTEINLALEIQLEEQQVQITQAFEMKCTLQKLNLHLEEKEREIAKLRFRLNEILQQFPPPPSPPSLSVQELSIVECQEGYSGDKDIHPVEPSSAEDDVRGPQAGLEMRPTGKHESHGENYGVTDEEIEENGVKIEEGSAALLLESLSVRTLEAEMKAEIDSLNCTLEKAQLDLAVARAQIEELQSSKSKLEKKLQRDVVELKHLVRTERERKSEVEAECHRLLARLLELSALESHAEASPIQQMTSLPPTFPPSCISPYSTSLNRPPLPTLAVPPHVRMSGLSSSLVAEVHLKSGSLQEQYTMLQREVTQLKTDIESYKKQLEKKGDIIFYLLRKYGLKEEPLRDSHHSKQSTGLFGLFGGSGYSSTQLSTGELQSLVEQTLLDNIRLRHDLQTMAQESGSSDLHSTNNTTSS